MIIKCALEGCTKRFRKTKKNEKYCCENHRIKAQNKTLNKKRKNKGCFTCGNPCFGYQCRKCTMEKKGSRLNHRLRVRERKLRK